MFNGMHFLAIVKFLIDSGVGAEMQLYLANGTDFLTHKLLIESGIDVNTVLRLRSFVTMALLLIDCGVDVKSQLWCPIWPPSECPQ